MRPGQPSSTAQWVAFARGLGPWHEPALSDDPLAATLLGGTLGALLGVAAAVPPLTRALVRFGDFATGGRTRFMCYRTRVLDDAVRAAAAEGIDQLVILGAGLDSRAWRLGSAVAGMTVFEVDHPDTQALKRSRLGERPLQAADVHFVGVDFGVDSLEANLLAAGFNPVRPALVLWEGVVMYLHPAAIDATLATLRGLLAPGSAVATSYSRSSGGRATLLRRLVGLVVGAMGEPFRHHEEPAQMRVRMERAGFRVRWDEGHPDWVPRYTGGATTWDMQRIVLAEPQP